MPSRTTWGVIASIEPANRRLPRSPSRSSELENDGLPFPATAVATSVARRAPRWLAGNASGQPALPLRLYGQQWTAAMPKRRLHVLYRRPLYAAGARGGSRGAGSDCQRGADPGGWHTT